MAKGRYAERKTYRPGQPAFFLFFRKKHCQNCEEQCHHIAIHGKHIGKSGCQCRKRNQQSAHCHDYQRVCKFQQFRQCHRRQRQPEQTDQTNDPRNGKIRRKAACHRQKPSSGSDHILIKIHTAQAVMIRNIRKHHRQMDQNPQYKR